MPHGGACAGGASVLNHVVECDGFVFIAPAITYVVEDSHNLRIGEGASLWWHHQVVCLIRVFVCGHRDFTLQSVQNDLDGTIGFAIEPGAFGKWGEGPVVGTFSVRGMAR